MKHSREDIESSFPFAEFANGGKAATDLEMAGRVGSTEPASECESLDAENVALQWENLTNEIMRLEKSRSSAIQLSASPQSEAGEPIARVLKIHEQKITECERKLDRLLTRQRRRSPVAGILIPNYGR